MKEIKYKSCELGGGHMVRSLWKAKTKSQLSSCRDCWMKSQASVRKEINKCARKPIKPVADKRAKELAIYRKTRDDFFKKYSVCQYPGCNSTQITLHHMKGRSGEMVYNDKYFVSLCWPHHDLCERNPDEAKRLNLSVNRLDK